MRVTVKFVKAAKLWCRTTVTPKDKGGVTQTQEWFKTEEEAKEPVVK